MDGYRVNLKQRVELALNSLSDSDRDRVQAALFRLAQGPSLGVPPQVYRVRGAGRDLHVLRATDQLRVLFSVKGKSILVEDVVNHDLVREYFQQPA